MRSHNSKNLHVVRTSDKGAIRKILEEQKTDQETGRLLDWAAIEYINPHLVEGRKWDFRVMVLVFGTDPLRIFLGAPEICFAKFTVRNFTFDTLGDDVHAANGHAVLKYAFEDFTAGKHSKYIRSLDKLKQFFTAEAWASVWEQVEQAVLRTTLAVEPRVRYWGEKLLQHGSQCYEMLGFDFMLDAQARLFLMEVNRNIAYESIFSTRTSVISQMLHDVLCVVGASCAHASRLRVKPIPKEEREFLQPFEAGADELGRLTEDYTRQLARAARTSFAPLWPHAATAANLAWETAAELDRTEEWAPGFYTRHLLPELREPDKRVLGVAGPNHMVRAQ